MADDALDGPVVVSGDNAGYSLNAGEAIGNAGGPAALTTTGQNDNLEIDGTVDGGLDVGLLISAAAKTYTETAYGSPWTFADGSAAITVGASGIIRGATGLLADVPIDDRDVEGTGTVSASLDNFGTIEATSGPAILTGYEAAWTSIVNEASGHMGGVDGVVERFSNAGTVDGGDAVALSAQIQGTVENSGTITSANDVAAIVANFQIFNNTGEITNTGNGAAIVGNDFTIVNSKGGTIAAADGDAIRGSDLHVTNNGTIDGNIVSTDSYYYSGTVVDQSGGGTIDGNVTLSAGNDVFVARGLGADGSVDTGVTGTLDGGTGNDMLQVGASTSATLGDEVLPKNFETIGLTLSHEATITLDAKSVQAVSVGGKGTFVNAGTMTTDSGPVISSAGSNGQGIGTLWIENSGTIEGQGYGVQAAVAFQSVGEHVQSFENSGSIHGDEESAVAIYSDPGRYFSFVNSGTISSGVGDYGYDSEYAAAVVEMSGSKTDSFLNTGLIKSTIGIGLVLERSFGFTVPMSGENDGSIRGYSGGLELTGVDFVNHGSIGAVAGGYDYYGTNAGAALSGGSLTNTGGIVVTGAIKAVSLDTATLTNSGLVQSHDGDAISFSGPVTIHNEADGRIKADGAAITAQPYEYGAASAATIDNEGRIYGDLDLHNTTDYPDASGASSVTNSGYIRGSITFGIDDDHYLGTGGTISRAIHGGDGNDTLTGGAGHEALFGDAGDDTIAGGGGTDLLTGGAGADTFVFHAGDGGLKAYSADEITDFSQADGDRIDLSALAPKGGSLSFIGTAAFDGHAGEVRMYEHGGQTFVEADLDGHGGRDFLIKLDGAIALTAADFVL